MGLWEDGNEMMPDFGGLGVPFGSVYDEGNTTQKVPLGQRVAYKDGRVFRYAKAGGTIGVGNLVVAVPNAQAIGATYFGATSAVAPIAGEGGSIGDTKIRLSDDVTGVTLDEYAGGFLTITDATGEGYMYKIKGNEATGSAGTGFLVTLEEGIQVALDNTSIGSMVACKYNGVVAHTPADPNTQVCVGRAMVSATVGEYIWIQVKGVASVKAGVATIDVGEEVILAEDDAGSGQTGLAENVQVIGTALADGADTVWAPVLLDIEE